MPVMVRVNAGPPATTVAGFSALIANAVMGSGTAFDTAPSAVAAVILAIPGDATSEAATCAVSLPLFTNEVESAAPFQRTVVVLVKPEPFTVRVKAGFPAMTVGGSSDMICGPGLRMRATATNAVEPPPATVMLSE